MVVEESGTTPLVFTQSGRYRGRDGNEHVAFARGGLYFRHGAKSEAATGVDVRDFIRRQLDATRTQWLANIRQVMHAPDGAEVAVVETAERDEEGRPTLIRLTTDPHAPLYGQVDPDQSHPYRQKEVINEVNARLGEGTVECVRRAQRAPRAPGLGGDEAGVRPRPEVRLAAVQRRVRGLAGRRNRA